MRRLSWLIVLSVLGLVLYQRKGIPVPEFVELPGGETEVRLSFLKWPELQEYITTGTMPIRPPAESGIALFRI